MRHLFYPITFLLTAGVILGVNAQGLTAAYWVGNYQVSGCDTQICCCVDTFQITEMNAGEVGIAGTLHGNNCPRNSFTGAMPVPPTTTFQLEPDMTVSKPTATGPIYFIATFGACSGTGNPYTPNVVDVGFIVGVSVGCVALVVIVIVVAVVISRRGKHAAASINNDSMYRQPLVSDA